MSDSEEYNQEKLNEYEQSELGATNLVPFNGSSYHVYDTITNHSLNSQSFKSKVVSFLLYTTTFVFYVLLVLGFFIIMMPLSDPETFYGSVVFTLGVGGVFAIVGLCGIFVLRKSLRKHPRFRMLTESISYSLIGVTGAVCIGISTDNKPDAPYFAVAIIYGIGLLVAGVTLLLFSHPAIKGSLMQSYQQSKKINIIAGIIAICIGVTAALSIHNFLYQQQVEKDKILNEGSRIRAIVTDLKHMSDSEGESYTVKYTFQSFQGVIKGHDNLVKSTFDQLRVGSPIVIAYDPTDPSRNLPAYGTEEFSIGLAIFLLSTPVTLFSFFMFRYLLRWIDRRLLHPPNKMNYPVGS